MLDMFQWLTHDRSGGIVFVVHGSLCDRLTTATTDFHIVFVVHGSLCDRLTTATTDFPFQHASFELAHLSINLYQHCL